MKELILVCFLLFPTMALACSPPIEGYTQEWGYANPCGMDVDLEVYEKVKKDCVFEGGSEDACNEEAYKDGYEAKNTFIGFINKYFM